MTIARTATALAATLFLAGCAGTSSPSPGSASAVTVQPGGTVLPSACAALATAGTELTSTVRRFAVGAATADEVWVAAANVGAAVTTLRSAPYPTPGLDSLESALTRTRDSLSARPLDVAAVRTAATDTTAAAQSAVAHCRPNG